jgi:TIGR00299 family protein
MKILSFEPFSGASGDMILGALIDLGASASFIQEHIEPLAHVSFRAEKISKQGISATDVSIIENSPNNVRHFSDICDIVLNTPLPVEVKENALAVFQIIADAESKVHNVSLDQLHFHETGQDDAIADVVGVCLAFYDLKSKPESAFDRIVCGNINVGGGVVDCCHGTLPVPAPATLEILKAGGLPFYSGGKRELLTPTGAAILSHFVSSISDSESAGKVLLIGYGSGKAELPSANVLRVSLIEELPSLMIREKIEILETNVDDVTGEVLGYLSEKLMAEGALDVSIVPIYMKKGRPAHLLKVISRPNLSEKLAQIIIRETGSLGVRVIPTKHRLSVRREMISLPVVFSGISYDISFKIARFEDGELVSLSAEYEDCKQISLAAKMPLREVIRKAEEEAHSNLQE